MIGTDDDDLDIDLELYCCKFYDKNIHVKHTYFLIIPTDKTVLPSTSIMILMLNPTMKQ